MGIEENKEVVRRFNEGRNKRDLSVVDELVTSNFVGHNLGTGIDSDRESLKRTPILDAFPDSVETIDDMIGEGDKVSMRWTFRGTHTGQLRNIAPTGKNVTIARFSIFRLESGKIAEAWILNDSLSFYQQLGVLPPTEEIGK